MLYLVFSVPAMVMAFVFALDYLSADKADA